MSLKKFRPDLASASPGSLLQVEPTELSDVLEITPMRFADDRGWFSEAWNQDRFAEFGLRYDWVQDNESLSAQAGTLRGIHFQIEPAAQDKLVRCVAGRIFDVAVDLRRGSATFGRWVGRELSDELGNQLLIPKGFGHGFVTLVAGCRVLYKTTAPYAAEHDCAIAWDDPSLAIGWPVDRSAITLSSKDKAAPTLAGSPMLFD